MSIKERLALKVFCRVGADLVESRGEPSFGWLGLGAIRACDGLIDEVLAGFAKYGVSVSGEERYC
jgi:hypothetical protein